MSENTRRGLRGESLESRLSKILENKSEGNEIILGQIFLELKKEYPKLLETDLQISNWDYGDLDRTELELLCNTAGEPNSWWIAAKEMTPLFLACVAANRSVEAGKLNIRAVVKLCEIIDPKTKRLPPPEKQLLRLLYWSGRNYIISLEKDKETKDNTGEVTVNFFSISGGVVKDKNKITLSTTVENDPVRFYVKAILSTGKLPDIQTVRERQAQSFDIGCFQP